MTATDHLAKPDISVCIANFNGGEFVLECLASVFAQQGSVTFEVLVHDDASTDGSLDQVRDRFPEARVIASSTNSGYCISNNRMVRAALGQYVLLLNNDASLRQGSLERLLEFARRGNEDCILGLPEHHIADGALVDCGYRTDLFQNPIAVMEPGPHEVGVATGACLWIPRRVWESVGGFPEWFESVAEDIFFCLAARLLGFRVMVLDEPGFDHWVGKNLGGGKLVEGGLRTTERRRTLSERNKTFVMLCCYPAVALLFLLPVHLSLLAIEGAFLLVFGIGTQKVRRIYASIPHDIWAYREEIKWTRKHLMHRRRISMRQLFQFTDWVPQKLAMLAKHGMPEVS